METADIGLIGLAVMGENLALNFEGKGYAVAVYNRRSPGREHAVDRFVEGRGRGKRLIGTHSIRELVESVRRPRRILMMIRAGEPVDEVIGQLMPYLEQGDVVIDGGNSDSRPSSTTARRAASGSDRADRVISSKRSTTASNTATCS